MKSLEQQLKSIEYRLCLLENNGCIQIVFQYKDIIRMGKKRFILVLNDENNNGDKSLYLFTEIELMFLQTAP